MIFLGRLYLVFSWSLAIFILISAPMPEYIGEKVTLYDKMVHVVLFGVLAYLIVYTLITKTTQLKLVFLVSFLLSVLYSGLSEYIQIFVPGRDVSEFDFMAGVLGIILALIYAYNKFRYKKV